MNQEPEQDHAALVRRNPFWVCLLVFLVLGVDNGFRLARVVEQRQQVDRLQHNQAQIVAQLETTLSQQPQFEARLQGLSLDLLQLGKTNAAAQQIVQEFKIQWMPGSTAAPAPAAANPPSEK
jgi:hypothetical protein